MIEIDIPGFGEVRLAHAVLDFNGTLARDGVLEPGIRERIDALAAVVRIHVVTADTFGRVAAETAGLPVELHRVAGGREAEAKAVVVERLGARGVVAIGNGNNDRRMLRAARLAVAVAGPEGMARAAREAADVIVPDAPAALDLLLHPLRLKATLRT
jgi:soluble P-type ATPase